MEARPISRALLSVTDKTGIVEFAKILASCGVELVSTGGTAKVLREADLVVRDVSELTGIPEMMGGRVKTLSHKIAGGILARRSNEGDMASVIEHGIQLVDMVVVNLYDFVAASKKPGLTFDELVEQIDIGGPTMLRAAAKNWRSVAVVTYPNTYERLGAELVRYGGLSDSTRHELMVEAFKLTCVYDSMIADALARRRDWRR